MILPYKILLVCVRFPTFHFYYKITLQISCSDKIKYRPNLLFMRNRGLCSLYFDPLLTTLLLYLVCFTFWKTLFWKRIFKPSRIPWNYMLLYYTPCKIICSVSWCSKIIRAHVMKFLNSVISLKTFQIKYCFKFFCLPRWWTGVVIS